MKRAAKRVLAHPFFVRAAFSLTRHVAPIFTFHRFRDRESGNSGHDPEVLRANLAWLRANRFTVLPVAELLDRIAEGSRVTRTVAFTVDDGYADFERIAAPLFAEFDCPVTVFLATGFLDGQQWLWWDRVAAALEAKARATDIWPTINALKLVPESKKLSQIDEMLRDAGLSLPRVPPARFAPMTWDQVRSLSRSGVTFGPHSVTHPVLARTEDAQSLFEIAESWRRVRSEAGSGAIPVFCYPNGEQGDFGRREMSAVAANGLRAAVSTRAGYLRQRNFAPSRDAERFMLQRFAYSDDRTSLVQIASGVERAKMALRSLVGRGEV